MDGTVVAVHAASMTLYLAETQKCMGFCPGRRPD